MIPNVYSFAVVKNVRNFKLSELFRTSICYSVDADLVGPPIVMELARLSAVCHHDVLITVILNQSFELCSPVTVPPLNVDVLMLSSINSLASRGT